MRMRFWATIRSPAFSIRTLIAPVRLRAVASGLIIEKVRSIAMISSLQKLLGVAALISALRTNSKRPGQVPSLSRQQTRITTNSRILTHSEGNIPASFSFAGIALLLPSAACFWRTSPGAHITRALEASEPEETTMLRKLSLAAVAAASLLATAMVPTSASAFGGFHGGHGGFHHGWGWGGPRFFVGGPAFYGPAFY